MSGLNTHSGVVVGLGLQPPSYSFATTNMCADILRTSYTRHAVVHDPCILQLQLVRGRSLGHCCRYSDGRLCMGSLLHRFRRCCRCRCNRYYQCTLTVAERGKTEAT
jgi:hypothetical protein